MRPAQDYAALAKALTEQLRIQPLEGGILNALQHMWGHVSDFSPVSSCEFESWSLSRLLAEIRERSLVNGEQYLSQSTALSELEAWLKPA